VALEKCYVVIFHESMNFFFLVILQGSQIILYSSPRAYVYSLIFSGSCSLGSGSFSSCFFKTGLKSSTQHLTWSWKILFVSSRILDLLP
jgi:hypothetical protein